MNVRPPTTWRLMAPLPLFAATVGLALGLASTPSEAAGTTSAAVKPSDAKAGRKPSPHPSTSEDAALEHLRMRLAQTLGAKRVANATTPSVRVVAKTTPTPSIQPRTTKAATKAAAPTCR